MKLGTRGGARVGALTLFCLLAPIRGLAQAGSETVEKGSFRLHSLLHAIGEETYELKRAGGDELVINISSELTDRSNKRAVTATLRMKTDLSPVGFEQKRAATPTATIP